MFELAAALSDAIGQNISEHDIRSVGAAAPGVEVADATHKFIVSLPNAIQGFVIVSGTVNPDLIGRAARNIAKARADLPTEISAPILPPIATGQFKGLSFALWPFRTTLLEGGKIDRYMRRHRYASQICSWHLELVSETLVSAPPETSIKNLTAIVNNDLLSEKMRKVAHYGLKQLQTGKISLKHCLQHGDFWTGNILQPDPGDSAPFFVIDWAGMNHEGYPFIDLCTMLGSLRCSNRFAAQQMAALQARVGCDRSDLLTSVLNGLGYLGRNLEHFPPERYRVLAEEVFHFAGQITR